MSEPKTETINMVPDHVANMRLGVMLAARGVTNEGLEGILKEAEKVGRLADAMCALLEALTLTWGKENTCESLLRDASECCYGGSYHLANCTEQRRALRDGLLKAAAVFPLTD